MRKRIEVVAVKIIKTVADIQEQILFDELVCDLINTTVDLNDKKHSIYIVENTERYIVGYVKTLKNRDLPPKENLSTNELSALNIDPDNESLAYANIYLYDKTSNVLLYEVNANGCYIGSFSKVLKTIWTNQQDSETENIEISFPIVLRYDAYNRILNMSTYTSIKAEISSPSQLIEDINSTNESIRNNILAMNIKAANDNGIETIKVEQKSYARKINPNGLSRSMIKRCIDFVRSISMRNVDTLIVKGYAIDPESNKSKSTTVDLIGTTFNNIYINLPDISIHSDLQISERKEQIIQKYNRILAELTRIFGE